MHVDLNQSHILFLIKNPGTEQLVCWSMQSERIEVDDQFLFLGSLMLMVLANEDDIETLIEKIEWTTLLFFGSLFVLMESLAELHLLDFIGDRTVSMIEQVDASIRFPVALLVVLWVSALSSSFVDNIPFTQGKQ